MVKLSTHSSHETSNTPATIAHLSLSLSLHSTRKTAASSRAPARDIARPTEAERREEKRKKKKSRPRVSMQKSARGNRMDKRANITSERFSKAPRVRSPRVIRRSHATKVDASRVRISCWYFFFFVFYYCVRGCSIMQLENS